MNLIGVTIAGSVNQYRGGGLWVTTHYQRLFPGNRSQRWTVDVSSGIIAPAPTIAGNYGMGRIPRHSALAASGSLQVLYHAGDAINAGAQWQADNGAWENASGDDQSFSGHPHDSFNTINGWSLTTALFPIRFRQSKFVRHHHCHLHPHGPRLYHLPRGSHHHRLSRHQRCAKHPGHHQRNAGDCHRRVQHCRAPA